MLEFGSDFHKYDYDYHSQSDYFNNMGETRLFACGRHAIDAIIIQEKWKRIWIPAYFCYDVIEHIKNTGIEVKLYDDYPTCTNDDDIVRNLTYIEGDVLLRSDYFGLRKWRSNKGIRVPVIEDHTHGLITDWALKSDADWCFASLRKSLPIAAGGILWSPKGKQLPHGTRTTEECKEMAEMRYEAMKLKADYLKKGGNKEAFRIKFINSEELIDNLAMSGIDSESEEIVRALNIRHLTDIKRDNWLLALKFLDKRIFVLGTEIEDYWQPFSLILLMDSAEDRERFRKYLIQNSIFPTILWRLPENSEFTKAKVFSEKMLSIHCDMRYSCRAIEYMCRTINGFYDSDL